MNITAPEIQPIKSINYPDYAITTLGNGIDIHSYCKGSQDVICLELSVKSGRWIEDKKSLAFVTASLLKEGTKSYTSEQIAENLDFYGASIRCQGGHDHTSIMLFSLTKYLDKVLPIFFEIYSEATFPSQEIEIFKQRQVQSFKIKEEKNEYLAQKLFFETIYGNDYTYGYTSSESTIDDLTQEDIHNHYKKHFSIKPKVYLAGKFTNTHFDLITDYLNEYSYANHQKEEERIINPSSEKIIYHQKENALQSAIFIGQPMFNKKHEDFKKSMLLNTVLGGYFGSRLMSNIREDKGYTYGIYSVNGSFQHNGYMYISTEVGVEHRENTLKEIYKELDILRNELIQEKELALVRNYLMGQMLGAVDGPFSVIGLLKALHSYDLTMDSFRETIRVIQETTPEELQNLANTYYNKESLFECVVG